MTGKVARTAASLQPLSTISRDRPAEADRAGAQREAGCGGDQAGGEAGQPSSSKPTVSAADKAAAVT